MTNITQNERHARVLGKLRDEFETVERAPVYYALRAGADALRQLDKIDRDIAYPMLQVSTDGTVSPVVTLRDQFAMAALSGWISSAADGFDLPRLAKWAYEVADSMLTARKAGGRRTMSENTIYIRELKRQLRNHQRALLRYQAGAEQAYDKAERAANRGKLFYLEAELNWWRGVTLFLAVVIILILIS